MKNKLYQLGCFVLTIVLLIFIIVAITQKYTRQTMATQYDLHIVKSGETLWKISVENYPSMDPRKVTYDIENINNSGVVIHPGQELKLPIYQ